MKIYVTEIPSEPKKCLFNRKDDIFLARTSDGAIYYPIYYCGIDNKECTLECSKECDKLIVFKQEK